MVTTREIVLATDDAGAAFGAYLAVPAGGPSPGVLMLPPIFGLEPVIKAFARRCAAHGFVTLALNQFWRDAQPQVMERTPEGRPAALARAARVDVDTIVGDMRTAEAWLRALPECTGAIGAIGFCFGGRYAFLAAARLDIDAAAAFHGSQIGLSLADAPNVRVPLSLHFGADDPIAPPDEVEAIRAALRDRDDAEIVVYPGAVHNFSLPGVPGYDAVVAAEAEDRAFALLDHLKPAAT